MGFWGFGGNDCSGWNEAVLVVACVADVAVAFSATKHPTVGRQ